MATVYHVFQFRGEEYRARLQNGILHTLCWRKSPNHPWRIVSPGMRTFVWLSHLNGKPLRVVAEARA